MKEPDSSYLLIAGGVGINPIYSILLSLIATDTNVNISMLYSAKSKDELVFSDIVELNHQARNMSVKYFVTQCQGGISTESTAIHVVIPEYLCNHIDTHSHVMNLDLV
ncbi:hypothetical protein EB796_017862 [Bugula neritina]|uniref:Oxidoreductase FAD/NAD(P)-binding domain-containing protein n=1 Tax=Bugula neritina TaxID=10212 RepID=A0A7J7JDW4_BUGNE|nr:hypothetical protein EB796_017862 [Bugula neritina]